MEISTHQEPFIYVNDKRYEITRDCDPEMSLNDFLRDTLNLKGTKVMCREAGCGCCTVCAVYKHPATGEIESKPVNSCVTPLYSAAGWHIVTIEGIGGRSQSAGYHPIQASLADGFGSQCGYCSPGFVMSAYSQLRDNPKATKLEVEHFFDGNICRCTGYRPILDSMKSFACDAGKAGGCLEDLERGCCRSQVGKVPTSGVAAIARGWKGQKFYNPGTLKELLTLLGRLRNDNYRLVFGNTSSGVFKEDAIADHYVNIRNVPELYKIEETEASLEIGSNLTLHDLLVLFARVANDNKQAGRAYLGQFSRHLQQVANQAVRRNGCWAGNLMLKLAHPEFPSDLFVLMAASGAIVKVADSIDGGAAVQEYTMTDFLRQDMRGRVVTSALLPLSGGVGQRFGSFKITPRALNAHAYLNAAFNVSVDSANGYTVTDRPRIVYGGVCDKFNHAVKTENYLQNKSLIDQETVNGAIKVLESELNPAEEATWSSPQHRRSLASNLLYKFILGVASAALPAADSSGAQVFVRRVQSAEQDFEQEPSELPSAPLGRACPKPEARGQTAGEAQYVNDAPSRSNELFGAFVLAQEAPAKLKGFGTEEAEQVPGYDRLITAKDLEGRYDNNYVSALIPPQFAQTEEILVTTEVRYAGQPLAIVLAKSQRAADRAAALVTVDLEQTGEPITSVAEAVAKASVVMEPPVETVGSEDVAKELDSQPCRIEGQIVVNEQAHFFMESLTASVTPCEEGLLISVPHQWADALVMTLRRVLRRPANELRVVTPRIGGGFGGKLIMSDLIACATCVAADIAQQPVRMYLTLASNMQLAMKRPGMLLRYKGAVNAEGKLRAADWEINNEVGYTVNMQTMIADELKHTLDMGYRCPNYSFRIRHMRTDKPESTFVRGPGPAVSSLANLLLMDHLAFEAGMDPIEFKFNNLYKDGDGDNFQRMWSELLQLADIEARRKEIEEFNKANTFRKRGLDMTAVSYQIGYDRGRPSQVYLTVQGSDGSVTLTHSGAEMGQGLGVKCAQAVAAKLNIDLTLIKLKPTDSHVTPNNDVTGGSSTSEWNCQAAVNAAEQINQRLETLRAANPQDSWPALVGKAVSAGICLAAMGVFTADNAGRKAGRYCSTGVGAVEAEVDVLTGLYEIRRVDITMDVGRSINPGVDIGQIEGAFVMGMGYYLMERTVYDADSGRNLTDSTWEYKVPQAADTPRDFRVHILKSTSNPAAAMSTKAIGEPPICLAPLCVTAIKRAVEAYREARGKPRRHLTFDMPLTPERVLMLCETSEQDRL
uniref:FAD-binding PCMH-type domain-containing protein n=1 Tax=Macrostomum lignano TaxID=282301 RepID=A0A1I8GJD8_9PLAT